MYVCLLGETMLPGCGDKVEDGRKARNAEGHVRTNRKTTDAVALFFTI